MTLIYDPLQDGKSKLQLIDWMGNDLSVINDAKASFEREAEVLGEKEIKLLNYLISHNHTSPLRGTAFKFKVKAPLFVCRQWWKHVIASNHNDEQLGWNEKSFRYTEIDDVGEFYVPKQFRKQSKSNKQASEESLEEPYHTRARAIYEDECHRSYLAYRQLIEFGVGREQARAILVPSVYTSWVWTASLQSVLHFIGLRQGEGAQSEIVAYAKCVKQAIAPIVPETIKAWSKHHDPSLQESGLGGK